MSKSWLVTQGWKTYVWWGGGIGRAKSCWVIAVSFSFGFVWFAFHFLSPFSLFFLVFFLPTRFLFSFLFFLFVFFIIFLCVFFCFLIFSNFYPVFLFSNFLFFSYFFLFSSNSHSSFSLYVFCCFVWFPFYPIFSFSIFFLFTFFIISFLLCLCLLFLLAFRISWKNNIKYKLVDKLLRFT